MFVFSGSITEEFKIEKSLSQSDPLIPLLRIIVIKKEFKLTREAIEKWLYKVGNDNFEVDILQFTNDTIFVGETSMNNVWMIKSELRYFELTSELNIFF